MPTPEEISAVMRHYAKKGNEIKKQKYTKEQLSEIAKKVAAKRGPEAYREMQRISTERKRAKKLADTPS